MRNQKVFEKTLIKELMNAGYRFIAEVRFNPNRKWKFDYANLENKIAIEIEGGVFTQGRHTRGVGFLNDIEKYNNAILNGWLVYRVVPSDLQKIKTLNEIIDLCKIKEV